MDTTETYIKMCEKAVEIQEGHTLEEGDYFSTDGVTGEPFCYEYSPIEGIWLPRQDQLQEMVSKETLEDSFISFTEEVAFLTNCSSAVQGFKIGKRYGQPDADYSYCKSWEQLWLLFVMQEKYGKSWAGTDWVKT